jgi:AP2-like factor (ANT lineage)
MASNTLLSGEHARRIKDNVPRTDIIEYNNDTNISNQNNGEASQVRNNNENDSKWKMVSNSCDQKNVVNSRGSYKNSDFSMSLQDLVAGQQHVLDDSNKIGTHFSNPSSLVTSLSSSREASPDKNGPSLLFPKLSMESKIATNNGVGVSSWFPSQVTNQMRPTSSINLSHFPVFAAWNDA